MMISKLSTGTDLMATLILHSLLHAYQQALLFEYKVLKHLDSRQGQQKAYFS